MRGPTVTDVVGAHIVPFQRVPPAHDVVTTALSSSLVEALFRRYVVDGNDAYTVRGVA